MQTYYVCLMVMRQLHNNKISGKLTCAFKESRLSQSVTATRLARIAGMTARRQMMAGLLYTDRIMVRISPYMGILHNAMCIELRNEPAPLICML